MKEINFTTNDKISVKKRDNIIQFFKNDTKIYTITEKKDTKDKEFPTIMYPFVSCYGLNKGQHFRIY